MFAFFSDDRLDTNGTLATVHLSGAYLARRTQSAGQAANLIINQLQNNILPYRAEPEATKN